MYKEPNWIKMLIDNTTGYRKITKAELKEGLICYYISETTTQKVTVNQVLKNDLIRIVDDRKDALEYGVNAKSLYTLK